MEKRQNCLRNFLVLAFLFYGITAEAQDLYLGFSFDPNKAFGLVDNSRTEIDHRGLDYDIEVGKLFKRTGLFVYYGAFSDADYQIYGAGADYYLLKRNSWQWSAGASIGSLKKTAEAKDGDPHFFAPNIRTILAWWLLEQVGLTARAQYQLRRDIAEIGIVELSLGIRYRFQL